MQDMQTLLPAEHLKGLFPPLQSHCISKNALCCINGIVFLKKILEKCLSFGLAVPADEI